MYVSSGLHVAQYVILQITDGLQGVGHVLVLLDVANDICSLCSFGKVDQIGTFDNRGYSIFNKGQVRQVDTCLSRLALLPEGRTGRERTEKWNAGRIGQMECFSILSKVLGTMHQLPHLFQHSLCSGIDLCPGPVQSTDRCCTKSGDDGSQCREVVHRAAFLHRSV